MKKENPNAKPTGNSISSLQAVLLTLFARFRYIFTFASQIGTLANRKKHWLVLVTLFGVCTLMYYFGELLDLIGLGAVRWQFLDQVHDIHRLLFLVPIMYACYFFGIKAMLIINTASLFVFLPRAIFISPFPDAIARSIIFVVFTGVLCSLVFISRNRLQQFIAIKSTTRNKRNNYMGVPNIIEDEVFVTRDLEVDLSRRIVKHHGQILRLTVKEYDLLSYLVRNRGKAISHTELLHNLWGAEYGQEREYLRNFVRQLRQKIEDDPSNPQLIVTEPGFGYRFIHPE